MISAMITQGGTGRPATNFASACGTPRLPKMKFST